MNFVGASLPSQTKSRACMPGLLEFIGSELGESIKDTRSWRRFVYMCYLDVDIVYNRTFATKSPDFVAPLVDPHPGFQ